MVDFEAERLAVPLRPCAARRTDFTDSGAQELSEQPFTGDPSVLGATQGEQTAERSLRTSFAHRIEVGSVDSEHGDPAADVRLVASDLADSEVTHYILDAERHGHGGA
ncbi:hypothetical protein BIV23_28285 [Streptomyces monashensis]|uniref:Uncharacterized protein n=1 Tax=Streptomyces monashensis TaxID=1678012 RepID=A0A1S2Q108_9ACTN|nr:hypothetical protein BIV23_28285 [Streptomyces monashensis]